jgi:glycerol kinase
MSKNTYGTGSFLLENVGQDVPDAGGAVLASVAWRAGGTDTFALEGSIFTTGAALRWLRDELHLVDDVTEVGPLAGSVSDSAGCIFVPALTGLGAPWWDPVARGAFLNLHGGVTRAHLVRAVVEAIAHRTRDVVDAMRRAGAAPIPELRVDGGVSVMDVLCQYQADVLGVPVIRSQTAEATALGAALLAAVGEGLIGSVEAAGGLWRPGRRFEPGAGRVKAAENYAAWLQALPRITSATTPP